MSSSPKRTGAGTKAPFPGFMEPALATSIEKVPRGARWVHEIKFDGYRVQLHIANDDIKVFTRRGNDWTKRFKKIAADAYRPDVVLRMMNELWAEYVAANPGMFE